MRRLRHRRREARARIAGRRGSRRRAARELVRGRDGVPSARGEAHMERVSGARREADRTALRNEVRTALALALVSPAPRALVETLAAVAGLLEALEELPGETPATRDLARSIGARA